METDGCVLHHHTGDDVERDFPRSGGGKIRKDLLVREILKKQRD
jgi:hypothetical protein